MSAINPQTETIEVVATQKGIYRDKPYRVGQKFRLVPIRMSNGKIMTAKEQLSEDRDIEIDDPRNPRRKIKQHFYGWMKVLGAGKPMEAQTPAIPEQTKAITDSTAKEQGSLAAPEGDLNEKPGGPDEEDDRNVI